MRVPVLNGAGQVISSVEQLGEIDRLGETTPYGTPAPTIGFAGHSVPATGVSNTATRTRMFNYGMAHWVPALALQGVETRQNLVIATAGITSAGFISRIPEVVAAKADNFVLDLGTNDPSFASFEQNMPTIMDAILGSNKRLILVPVMPRSLVTQATRDMYQYMAARAKEWGQLGIKGLHVVDVADEYGDPTSANWAPKQDPGNEYDDMHPAGLGGYRISKKIAALLRQFYPPAPLITSVASQFSAENPRGNLIPNGVLLGTGGTGSTNNGITVSGSAVPDGMNILATAPYSGGSALSGLTMAMAKLTDADGTNVSQITYTGGYVGDVDTVLGLRWSGGAGDYPKLVAGDWVEARCHFTLKPSAVVAEFAGFQLVVILTMGGTSYYAIDGYAVSSGRLPAEGYTAILKTPPLQVTATPTLEQVYLVGVPTQGTITIDDPIVVQIRNMQLTKVPAP